MRRHSFRASLALAILSSLGLASSLLAANKVPFKGTLEGSFTVIPVAPPAINRQLNATGNATLLGDFSYDFPHSVDRSVTPATGIGYSTFTAANGDQVFAYITGQATPVTPGVLHIVESGRSWGERVASQMPREASPLIGRSIQSISQPPVRSTAQSVRRVQAITKGNCRRCGAWGAKRLTELASLSALGLCATRYEF